MSLINCHSKRCPATFSRQQTSFRYEHLSDIKRPPNAQGNSILFMLLYLQLLNHFRPIIPNGIHLHVGVREQASTGLSRPKPREGR